MTDTAKGVKTYPAPEALATPTDLTSEEVQKTERRTWFLFEYLQDTDRFD